MKTFSTTLLLVLSFGFASVKMTAQPPNDHISFAIDLAFEQIPYPGANVDFANATNTDDDTPGTGCMVSHAGVWYTFTAEKTGFVVAGILNPDGATVVFFEGPLNVNDADQLTYVNQPNNNPCALGPLSQIQTTAGTTYYLYMRNLVTSDISINIGGAFFRPDNDLIANATDANGIADFDDSDVHFAMATDTNDGGQTNCDTGAMNGVWYKFTAQDNGIIFAVIGSPPTVSRIIFFSAQNENATSGADLTFVNQTPNICSLGNISAINATAGTSYYVFAASFSGYTNVSLDLAAVMGTRENTLKDFDFYPNPVDNELNLNARSIIDEVSIYNIQGKKVYFKAIGTKKSQLNLGKLSSGLYLITVFSEGKMGRYKLVKQ